MNSIQERFILKGQHFVCTGELTIAAATTAVLHIKTGENDIIFDNPLNLSLMADHVKITVHEDVVTTADGGANGIVSNNNRILKTAPTAQFFSTPTITDVGSELMSIKIFGSPDNATKIAQRSSGLGTDFGMMIFEKNKSYTISFENQDVNDTAEIGYSMTFFEVTPDDTLLG